MPSAASTASTVAESRHADSFWLKSLTQKTHDGAQNSRDSTFSYPRAETGPRTLLSIFDSASINLALPFATSHLHASGHPPAFPSGTCRKKG